MTELVPGDAFFTAARPRRLCSDCGRRVRWGRVPDAAHIFASDPEAWQLFQQRVPVGGLVYWCDRCVIAGWFSAAFVA